MRRVAIAGSLLLLMVLALVPGALAQSGETSYDVTITNLTTSQVFSPALLATHDAMIHVWQSGALASDGLRQIAESGDAGPLSTTLATDATDVVVAGGPLMPGASITLRISAAEGDVLSAATMLVQTNDAFTGLDNAPLTPGTIESNAYDGGTEENSELAADVPGPPFGGSGNPATSPAQPIAPHSGIRGDAEVGAQYDWSDPVARFEIAAVADAMPDAMPQTGRGGEPSPVAPLLLLAGAALLAGLLVTRRGHATAR